MPIKFACDHCGQVLKVSTDKAGKRAKCPKCREPITVPAESAAAESPAHNEPDTGDEEAADPFSQFMVYDDAELVYETEGSEGYDDYDQYGGYYSEQTVDHTKVAVPRTVLYIQGGLLGIVAIGCFAFGIFVGALTAPSGGSNDDGLPQPCVVRGTVAYEGRANEVVPDPGAVVVIVPQEARPDEKAAAEGLRPIDPLPGNGHPGLLAIQAIGGDYTRADENGEFRLNIPDTGRYFVLVVSRNSRRTANEPLNKTHLAQIGRYFLPAADMLGDSRYQWSDEQIKRDRVLNVVF